MWLITGFMKAQATVRRGSRCSSSKAFLRPARKRRNLDISKHSLVHKIVIDPSTKQATAVRFEKKGVMYQVQAKKEIILSAGSVNSPQLLMLSGVGPADHLQSLGIPVIADLPVGNNLQDHIALGGMIFTVDKVINAWETRESRNLTALFLSFFAAFRRDGFSVFYISSGAQLHDQ